MDFFIHPFETGMVVIFYVFFVLLAQALFQEIVMPRLSFSKTSGLNLKQMAIRWVLLSKRFDFNLRNDFLGVMMLAFAFTALSILPLSGRGGLHVDRPDLAIGILMAIFYFLRVFWGLLNGDKENWEKALEEILVASSRVFTFLLVVDGAYLASRADQFSTMMGEDWMVSYSPFHFLSFILGIALVGFFQGRNVGKNLRGLSLFSWKVESIFWITLLLVTYLNTSANPGWPFLLALVGKCVLILFFLDLIRSHIPKLRMDQIERIGLTVVYPAVILVFLGMWWRETLG